MGRTRAVWMIAIAAAAAVGCGPVIADGTAQASATAADPAPALVSSVMWHRALTPIETQVFGLEGEVTEVILSPTAQICETLSSAQTPEPNQVLVLLFDVHGTTASKLSTTGDVPVVGLKLNGAMQWPAHVAMVRSLSPISWCVTSGDVLGGYRGGQISVSTVSDTQIAGTFTLNSGGDPSSPSLPDMQGSFDAAGCTVVGDACS